MRKIIYLSLGSNLGDRERALATAMESLAGAPLRLLRASSIYETEPRDLPQQPWFLNLVLEAETEMFPRQLLRRTQQIEQKMGRKRIVAKGPRIIDIDILLFGRCVVDSPDLVIPHPRLPERRFVLEPLVELAPDLRHPVSRRTMRELLAATKGQVVRKVGSARWPSM
jgi:2-amino-4-hydroxy-6-hydroxymethyldihydropteridine diphosphokinase